MPLSNHIQNVVLQQLVIHQVICIVQLPLTRVGGRHGGEVGGEAVSGAAGGVRAGGGRDGHLWQLLSRVLIWVCEVLVLLVLLVLLMLVLLLLLFMMKLVVLVLEGELS